MKTNRKRPFDLLWDEGILPAVEQCVQECDQEFAHIHSIGVSVANDNKNKIYKQYVSVREQYKQLFHKEGDNASLDFTKLAAIICYTLVNNKLFNIAVDDKYFESDITKKYFIDNLLINYKIALYAALNITFVSLITEFNSSDDANKLVIEDKNAYEALKESRSLKIYVVGGKKKKIPKGAEQDSVIETIIKNLAYIDIHNRDYDFTAYAMILDGLREYTRLYYSKNIV